MNRVIKVECSDPVEERKLRIFRTISSITLKVRDEFFQTWRNSYLYPIVINKIMLKPYLRLINSDISASGSYLDSIYCDILYGDLSTRHENHKNIEINRYLNHSHIFTLFIIARSITLNTAYINGYYNIKGNLESYKEDTFEYIKGKIKNDSEAPETLIDIFQDVINIFDLGNGDQVSILSKFKNEINTVLRNKINSNGWSDIQLVKLLEYDISNLSGNNLKNNELVTLYELTSKSFHRHEVLLFMLNNWFNGNNQNTNIDLIVNNTILQIVKICTLLYGYQIDLFNKLLNQKETNIVDDFSRLMGLSYE